MITRDNPTQVLRTFLKELNISVSDQRIADELEKHADQGSMLSISDALDRLRVPNAAYRIDFDQLKDAPVPFIAHISKKEFAVVTGLGDDHAVLSNEKWNKKVLPSDDFKKYYSGTILLAEKDTMSDEVDYRIKQRKHILAAIRTPLCLIMLFLLAISYLLIHTNFVNATTHSIGLLILIKSLGLATTVVLLMQSLDANNPFVQKLCGTGNKNCGAILSTQAARLTSYLSWSEVGFFYFAGTWLAIMFNTSNSGVTQVLGLLNILTLPYTFYSIYYQWRVAKQWCVFCCTVQALLWLEFVVFLPSLSIWSVKLETTDWNALILAGLIPVLIWTLFKPYLQEVKRIKPLRRQLFKFKYNRSVFDKLIESEVKYALLPDELSLIMGHKSAENVITVVSSPYCGPCGVAHKTIEELLSIKPNIKLQVIFSTANKEDDRRTKVAGHLMDLQNIADESTVNNALDEWFAQENKNFPKWAEKFKAEKNVKTGKKLEAQMEWCKMTDVIATPTVFFNGRRLPKGYLPEDLKYVL